MDTIPDEDPVLTTAEAGRLLGVAVSTVQSWMNGGMLRSWKTPGGHRRTRLSIVKELIDSGVAGSARNVKASAIYQPVQNPQFLITDNEDARLTALAASRLIERGAEPVFDRFARLASTVTSTPIALVSMLTSRTQWIKAGVGLATREIPREWSFCTHTIMGETLFVVQDAAADARFSASPIVQCESGIRFYVGLPLSDAAGLAIGTLCVMDREPRRLRTAETESLLDLGQIVLAEIRRR